MKEYHKLYLAVNVLALSTALHAGGVKAQTAPQSAASDSGDIIVTARRAEERLQDVPISISVVTAEQISQRNIVTAADLGTYTPSLSVNSRFGPDKSSFVLRGFVQEQFTAPSVGVYFADVVAPRAGAQQTAGNGTGPGSFFDLQNVQVLKGAQGTLFGRNTTGGAVLITPQKPTQNLEGYVEASAGNYGMRRLQGALNLPLSDALRVRFSVDRDQTDGYLKNRSGIGPSRYADTNYLAMRLGIVADLTPDLENYTIASYSRSDTNGSPARLFACNPALTTSQSAVNGCAQVARHDARGDGPWDIDVTTPDPKAIVEQWQVINTTTWRASDWLTIKNIASYSQYTETALFSLNGNDFTVRDLPGVASPAYIGLPYDFVVINPGPDHGNTRQNTFTEELQLQGDSLNGRLKWQLGGYLEISRPPYFNQTFTAISLTCTDTANLQCVSPFGLSGSLGNQRTKFFYNNKGLYGQATFDLTSKLAVTAGLRYTIDRLHVIDASTRIRFPVSGPPVRFCQNIVRFKNPDNSAVVVSDPQQCRIDYHENSSRPTWLIDLEYKPIDDIMAYAKYTRGYRQGGVAPSNVGLETWGPEKVDTYEIGAKTQFRTGGVHGYFNIAGFYNDFTDQQITAFLVGKAGTGFAGGAAIVNAGRSVIKGMEIDSSATLFDQLKLDIGYTYLDAKVKAIEPVIPPANAPYSSITLSAANGDTLAYSPKNRVTLAGTWTLPLADSIGEVSVGATYVYTAKQIVTKASPYGTLPSSSLVNLNFNWKDVMGAPVDFSVFVTNVTNKFVPVSVINGWSQGYEGYIANAPRMWGARLRYRFD